MHIKKYLRLLFIILIAHPFSTFALCSHLSGKWSGAWVDYKLITYSTILDIKLIDKNHFVGTYSMSNGQVSKFKGSCSVLNSYEAILNIPAHLNFENICKGMLLYKQEQLQLHIFCFNPNDSGYFTKS